MIKIKCERSGIEIPLSEGAFVSTADSNGVRRWRFVSIQSEDESTDYAVPVQAMTKSPEAFIAWMSHMNKKSWFDANEFAEMCTRLSSQNSEIFKAM